MLLKQILHIWLPFYERIDHNHAKRNDFTGIEKSQKFNAKWCSFSIKNFTPILLWLWVWKVWTSITSFGFFGWLLSRINGLFIGQNQYQNTVSNKIITVKYEKAGSVQNLLFVHLFNYEEIMNKNRIIYWKIRKIVLW